MPVKIHMPSVCTIPSGLTSCLVMRYNCLSYTSIPQNTGTLPYAFSFHSIYQNLCYFKVINWFIRNSFVLSSTFFYLLQTNVSASCGFECRGKKNLNSSSWQITSRFVETSGKISNQLCNFTLLQQPWGNSFP